MARSELSCLTRPRLALRCVDGAGCLEPSNVGVGLSSLADHSTVHSFRAALLGPLAYIAAVLLLPRPPLNWITLYDEPEPVKSPIGVIYSTKPGTTAAMDGHSYYIKGPDLQTVVAEAVGYELARLVGLNVPAWALCRHPESGEIHFASRAARIRTGIENLFHRPGLIDNPEFLPSCVAFDVWTSNRDRNPENIVAEPVGGREGAEVRLYAIDFEKADVLRGTSRFEITERYTPSMCWPRGVLAPICRGMQPPRQMCDRIRAIAEPSIRAIFEELAPHLGGVAIGWTESATSYLIWRGERIDALVQEAWNA